MVPRRRLAVGLAVLVLAASVCGADDHAYKVTASVTLKGKSEVLPAILPRLGPGTADPFTLWVLLHRLGGKTSCSRSAPPGLIGMN